MTTSNEATAEAILDSKFARMTRMGYDFPPPTESIEQLAADWIATFSHAGYNLNTAQHMKPLAEYLEQWIETQTKWPKPSDILTNPMFQVACGMGQRPSQAEVAVHRDRYQQLVDVLNEKCAHIRQHVFIGEMSNKHEAWRQVTTCIEDLRCGLINHDDLATVQKLFDRVGEEFDFVRLTQLHATRNAMIEAENVGMLTHERTH